MEFGLTSNFSFWLSFLHKFLTYKQHCICARSWLKGLRFCVPGVCSWLLQPCYPVLQAFTWLYPGCRWYAPTCCHIIPRKMEESAPRRGRVAFGWLVGLSQVLGLGSVVLTGVWMGHYKGGFAWDGSAQQFNVHPLCMVLGLVFLQGDGESTKENHLIIEIFYDCVQSSFFPNAFGAAGVKWQQKCSKNHLQPDPFAC